MDEVVGVRYEWNWDYARAGDETKCASLRPEKGKQRHKRIDIDNHAERPTRRSPVAKNRGDVRHNKKTQLKWEHDAVTTSDSLSLCHVCVSGDPREER